MNIFLFVGRINLLCTNSLFKLKKIRYFVLYQSHRGWQHLPKIEVIKQFNSGMTEVGGKIKAGDSAVFSILIIIEVPVETQEEINEYKVLYRFMQTPFI